MKQFRKRIISIFTAAALMIGSSSLPYIRPIVPMSVTVSAETYTAQQYVDSCFSRTAKDAISREELVKAADLYFNVLQPQAVNLLINKIPAFKEAASKNELSRNVGVYIFYKKGDNDIDAHKVASLSAAAASIAQIDGGKVGIILQHDLYYLIVDGKMKTDNNEKAVWFINSVLHELVHSLMTDYNRTGLFGSGRPEYYGKKDPNADARIYVVNNYSQLKFPQWFLEGTACIVGGRDMEAVKELRAFSVSDDAAVHTYTAKSVFELYVKKTKYQLSSNNDTSLYSTSIPATLYLCELQAVKSGRSSINTDADGKKVFDSSVLRSGFNTILTRLHDGETLDAVITDISDGNFSSTDDFTKRFIKGDWNITEASEADPCKGMDNNSSQFTADLMNYLESLDVKYGHPVTCSILYDFDDPREYVLDISKKSTAEFYKPTLSGDYELIIDLPEPYTDGGKSAVGTSTPSREELYAFVKAEAEKEWAEFDAESFNSAGTKEAAAMTAILNSPSNFLKAAALAQERVDCNALLTYIIYTKPKAFDTFLDNSIKYDDSFIYDDDAFSLILEKIEEVPATCTEPGTAAYFIGNDGKKYDLYKEISDEDLVGPALGHDYVDGCCTRCGALNQYTITFDTAGGSEIAPVSQYFGTPIMTPAAPTKPGYVFAGWSPALPATMPAYDMTVTAMWRSTAPAYTPANTTTATTTTTTDTTPDISKLNIRATETAGNGVDIAWDSVPGASGYTLSVKIDNKFAVLRNVSSTFVDVVLGSNGKYYVSEGGDYTIYEYNKKTGKFDKTGTLKASKIDGIIKANNVTLEFMVQYTRNGKLSAEKDSYKITKKIYYKPALTLTTGKNSTTGKSFIRLKWAKVDGATKYRVYKLVNGKLKTVTELGADHLSLKINGTKSGKEYTFAVKALVDGKWTKVYGSDLASIISK